LRIAFLPREKNNAMISLCCITYVVVFNMITRTLAYGGSVSIRLTSNPLVGPSQTGIPAALRSGGTTDPIRKLADGTKVAGNVYQYQTVDAKGYGVYPNQAVQEYFTDTPNTDPNVKKGDAGTFNAKHGHFEDFVFCRVALCLRNEYLQNFRSMVLEGPHADELYPLSTQNLLTITPGAPATATNQIP
jgi:hypothetical protein